MKIPSLTPHRRGGSSSATAWKLAALALLPTGLLIAQHPYYPNTGRSPVVQYSNTAWSLEKTGTFVPGATANTGTVNWSVDYTKGATTTSLVALGYIQFSNFNGVPVTVDSIVINLQVGGVTVTSNVATRTDGDAATAALIDPTVSSEGLFFVSENAGSGTISLIDGDTDTPTTLDGGDIVIPVGAGKTFYFFSSYNPAAVGLATGSPVRAEVIVMFSNGYGTGFRQASLIPAPVEVNGAPTLSDTTLTTTGTVTTGAFSGLTQTVTGSGSASLSVSVDGGTNGGSVCNTATLVGGDPVVFPILKHDETVATLVIPAVNLEAVNCVDLPGTPGSGGTYGTNTPGGWGAKPAGNNPGARLAANFASVYPSGIVIGSTHTLTFTSAKAVEKFLPQGGKPKALTASVVNPTKKLTVFAGQTLALKLNIDFSTAGLMPGDATNLGSLKVTSGPLTGYTASQVLAFCNLALGGNAGALPAGITLNQLNEAADAINNNYVDGGTDNGFLAP